MTQASGIEWTGHTWNPIAGCSVLSPGCANCYAMRMAARIEASNSVSRGHGFSAATQYDGTTKRINGNPVWTGKVNLAADDTLLAPLKRKKPTTYFVNSMSDLFHEAVPDEWIDRIFAIMALCPQHIFQVLTKRSDRMRDYIVSQQIAPNASATQARICQSIDDLFPDRTDASRNTKNRILSFKNKQSWSLPNVWLGVSAERQKEADERIPDLLAIPAAVRFLSAEPLLGPIDLMDIIPNPIIYNAVHGMDRLLDWVIVGGESGPGARPMHPDWARSLRDQCASAGVLFFFKQWGEWAPQVGAVDGWTIDDNPEISRFDHLEWDPEKLSWGQVFRPMWCDFQDGHIDEIHCVSRIGKRRAGRSLDGVEHNAMPGAPT